jgi:hypothetical protein
LIFWYVAKVDSTISKVEGTQEAYKLYDTAWAGAEATPGMVSRFGDKEIVTKTIETALGVGKLGL